MPELNREDIIKALECCIGRRKYEDCIACPYDKRKHSCVICLMRDALTLIKQLTEENEKLKEKADRHLDNLKAVLDERAEQDVAREIFEEIEKCFFEELVGCTEAKVIDEEMFADLKKKYIGE